MSTSTIEAIIKLLEDNEFRCPATSGFEVVGNDDVVEQAGDVFNLMGIPEGPLQGNYDDNGYCQETLTVDIETEYGEMGSILARYPIILWKVCNLSWV